MPSRTDLLLLILSFVVLFIAPAGAADLILHASGLTGKEAPDFLSEESGLITVPAGIGLVSSFAYEGAGTLSEAHLLDHRLHVTVGETEGPDTVAAGSTANPFAALGNRRTVNLSGGAWRDGDDGLTFNGTMVEASRTLIDGDTGLPFGEEHHRAVGSGLNLSTYHNRLRGLAELAWSRNSTPEMEDEAVGDHDRIDSAWRARLDADLSRGDGHALSAWGYKRRVDPGYLAPRGDAPANRDEIALGGHGRLGITTVDLSFIEFVNNLDRKENTLTTRDRAASATLGFDLAQYRVSRLSPRAVRFTVSRGSLLGMPELSDGEFSDDAITDEERSSFSVAADWPVAIWGDTETLTVTLTRSAVDNQRPGMETADTADDAVSITHAMTGSLWSGSLSATAADSSKSEVGNRSVTRKYALSANAVTSIRTVDRLSLTVNVAQNRIAGIDSGVNRNIDTTWEVTAGGELNRLLGSNQLAGVLPLVGYVSVKGNDPDETESGIRTVDVTAGLKTRLTF